MCRSFLIGRHQNKWLLLPPTKTQRSQGVSASLNRRSENVTVHPGTIPKSRPRNIGLSRALARVPVGLRRVRPLVFTNGDGLLGSR
jgi:hypothetical protein